LSHLGFGREAKQLVENFLKRRRGLIIVAGGDNQGKTTTLYALLDRINRDKRLCYALEKYSEISLNGLNKIKVRPDRRAAALDRLLKTDSDVIMADDVDDRLLGSAVAASRTGRLILVGYKTERLADLVALVRSLNRRGDPPILLLQQQLLDRNCPHCLEAYAANGWEEFLDKYWPENKRYRPRRFFTSRGCPRCHYSGTKGRIASFNLVRIDERQVNLVSALATDTLEKAANGLVSLRHWLDHKLEKEK
jgi:type II secretory ATPase GspE/PulE/Tfp pilus assembly ATPase PilB-like protein